MTMAEELIAKGRLEGRAEAGLAVLLRLLTRKFGDIPPEYRARIDGAAPDLLEQLAERTLFANTLAAVFADE